MPRLISESYPVAKKEYMCRACQDMRESGDNVESILQWRTFTDEEKEILRKALVDDNGRILNGEKYYCQKVENDGDIYSYRAKSEVFKIAIKYNLLTDCD